jgi:hypothetical protein
MLPSPRSNDLGWADFDWVTEKDQMEQPSGPNLGF